MKKNVLLLVLTYLSSHFLFSQHRLIGKVQANNQPLEGAAIQIIDLKRGTLSNEKGEYELNDLPQGKFLVECSYYGYGTKLQQVIIENETQLNFSLEEAVSEMGEVLITGLSSATSQKQNPVPTLIINNLQANTVLGTNLIDKLNLSPGISQITTGGAVSKPVIRGMSYNRVITLYDGMKQEGQQWGDEHGIEIDEYAIDKVEIIKGAGSILYGSDGIGGVISFLSPQLSKENTFTANYLTNYQTNNQLFGNSLSLDGNIKGLYFQGRYSHKIVGNYQNKYDQKVFNSGFLENNASGHIGLTKKWGLLQLNFSTFNQTLGMVEGDRDSLGHFTTIKSLNDTTEQEVTVSNADLKGYQIAVPYQKIHHKRIGITHQLYIGKNRLSVDAGWQQNSRQEYGDVLNPNNDELHFHLDTYNYNVKYNFLIRNTDITIGTNGDYQQNTNKGEEYLIPDYQLFEHGYVVYAKHTHEKFSVMGGIRYDIRNLHLNGLYYDDLGNYTTTITPNVLFTDKKLTFQNVSASVGTSYFIDENVTLKANVSRGFRSPNASELSVNGAHEGTNRYEYGNLNLKSETNFQLDAGILLNTEHFTADINVFRNQVNNYIFLEKMTNLVGTDSVIKDGDNNLFAFHYLQGNALFWGSEMTLDIHPHPYDWLHFENSFGFVNTLNLSRKNNDSLKYLPFIPPARLRSELRANLTLPTKHLKASFAKIEMEHYFEQNRVLFAYNTETKTPAYTLWNIGIGTELQHKEKTIANFQLSLQNIFDVAYQNHLNRLKYTAINPITQRQGVFNMGRNLSIKLIIPLSYTIKTK